MMFYWGYLILQVILLGILAWGFWDLTMYHDAHIGVSAIYTVCLMVVVGEIRYAWEETRR